MDHFQREQECVEEMKQVQETITTMGNLWKAEMDADIFQGGREEMKKSKSERIKA
jgi:hypothetical protein